MLDISRHIFVHRSYTKLHAFPIDGGLKIHLELARVIFQTKLKLLSIPASRFGQGFALRGASVEGVILYAINCAS